MSKSTPRGCAVSGRAGIMAKLYTLAKTSCDAGKAGKMTVKVCTADFTEHNDSLALAVSLHLG